MSRFSDEPEWWMTNLDERIRHQIPIINLAIPGSHDSTSYAITRKSKLAPDAEKFVKFVFPYVPFIVRRWAKTQKLTITEQLNNGIRFVC
jgi:hypothetical protein